MPNYEVKDSGKREEYASGMRRDTQEGKPDYTLIDQVGLERVAIHLVKGAEKYGRDNWRKANSEAELIRFKSSAIRHIFQWLRGDTDEDHMAAVVFNLFAAEYVKERLKGPKYQPNLILYGGENYTIKITHVNDLVDCWYNKYLGEVFKARWVGGDSQFVVDGSGRVELKDCVVIDELH